MIESPEDFQLDMFGNNISKRTQSILDKFKNAKTVLVEDQNGKTSVIQIVDDLGRREVKVNDLGKLQAATGNEFSLVRGPNGERVLLQGDPTKMMIPSKYVGDGWKWSGHSHPYSATASDSDIFVLKQYGQEQSVIKSAGYGNSKVFTANDDDMSNWLPGPRY